MSTGASLGRGTRFVLIVATLLVGLLVGDSIGEQRFVGGIANWCYEAERREYTEAIAAHRERELAAFDAKYGERVRVLEEEIAPLPPISPATLALLKDVEALRKALGFHRHIDWEGFRMEPDERHFRPTHPLTLEDLPEEALVLIERIAEWDSAHPDAHWGDFDEEALVSASPSFAAFCTDKFQSAMAEVIPAEHHYWRTIARLTFMSNPYGPPLYGAWSTGSRTVLRWLMGAGAEGRALVRAQLNPPSRIREKKLWGGLPGLRSAASGLTAIMMGDPQDYVDANFVAPSPLASEEIERALHALEVLGQGKRQGESWRSQAILWRWATGEEDSPYLDSDPYENPLVDEALHLLMPSFEED